MSTDNTLSQAASFDDATSTDELIRRDRKVTFHASTHLRDYAQGDAPGRVITGGEGIRIRERDGRELIDGFAGLYCVNIGYGRTEVADAIHEQALKLSYYHTYVGHSNEPQIALSEKIDAGRAEMDAQMAKDDPDFDRVDALEEQVDWDQRIFSDRQQTITYLCETPTLLEKRLYAISQMLQEAGQGGG